MYFLAACTYSEGISHLLLLGSYILTWSLSLVSNTTDTASGDILVPNGESRSLPEMMVKGNKRNAKGL